MLCPNNIIFATKSMPTEYLNDLFWISNFLFDSSIENFGLALNEVIELLDGFWLRNRIDWWSDDQF